MVLQNSPAFVGWRAIFNWDALEHLTLGNYQFAAIDAELTRLRDINAMVNPQNDPAKQKRLVIVLFVDENSVLGSNGVGEDGALPSVLPNYLLWDWNDYGPGPTNLPTTDAWHGSSGWEWSGNPSSPAFTAALWRPKVMARFIALIQALGAKYNSEPLLEGILLPETNSLVAPGTDWSDAALEPQLESLITAAVQAFPNTNVAIMHNELGAQGPTNKFTNFLVGARAAMSTPDAIPESGFQARNYTDDGWGHLCYMGLPASAVPGTPPSPPCSDLRPSMAIMQEVESPDYNSSLTSAQLVDFYNYLEGPPGGGHSIPLGDFCR